jgi:hypothetical protein
LTTTIFFLGTKQCNQEEEEGGEWVGMKSSPFRSPSDLVMLALVLVLLGVMGVDA